MKGATGAMGAVILHAMFDHIDTAARANELGRVEPMILGLSEELARALRALKRLGKSATFTGLTSDAPPSGPRSR